MLGKFLLVRTVCIIVVLCIGFPCFVSATGTKSDYFYAPLAGEQDPYAEPEIVVELNHALLHIVNMLKVKRFDYYERMSGFVAGYMKKEADGTLLMCACTKWTSILYQELVERARKARALQEMIYDFEDLTLDRDIEVRCQKMGTREGCIKYVAKNDYTIPKFCPVFLRESDIQVKPLQFSLQSYFYPGLRVLGVSTANQPIVRDIYAESNVSETYFGSHVEEAWCANDGYKVSCIDDIDTSGAEDEDLAKYLTLLQDGLLTHGLMSHLGPGLMLSPQIIALQKKFDNRAVSKTDTKVVRHSARPKGLAAMNKVYRMGEDVCLQYREGAGTVHSCVPVPDLERPMLMPLTSRAVGIRFKNCVGSKGNHSTKYCMLRMIDGMTEPDTGFALIKPKLNVQDYSFESEMKCQNGKESDAKNPCRIKKAFYKTDEASNVRCLVYVPISSEASYLKRGLRYHWIKPLRKMLVARSYDPQKKLNVQCGDGQSLNLATMDQSLIDKFTVRRGVFYPEGYDNNAPVTGSAVEEVCKSRLFYSYSNYRAFEIDKPELCNDSDLIRVGSNLYCRTKYVSMDNHEPFFMEKDSEFAEVKPLNHMLQGMCVSNFPEHKYLYSAEGEVGSRRYLLDLGNRNAQCDFIKIEAWGGGQSSSVYDSEGVGRSGTYVMGILRLDKGKSGASRYLTIHIGAGGRGNEKLRVPGGNTVVKLCDDTNEKVCSMQLVALGGGREDTTDSSYGHHDLVHYRVAEGRSKVEDGYILIPYQDIDNDQGMAKVKDGECVSSNTLEKNSNTYPGAGGCINRRVGAVQEGADGMVKITCEKWSGPQGKVKEWEGKM